MINSVRLGQIKNQMEEFVIREAKFEGQYQIPCGTKMMDISLLHMIQEGLTGKMISVLYNIAHRS